MLSARQAKYLAQEFDRDLDSYLSIFEEHIRSAAKIGKLCCDVNVSNNNFSWEDFRDAVSELLDEGYSLRVEDLYVSCSLLGGFEEKLEKVVLRELADIRYFTVGIYW